MNEVVECAIPEVVPPLGVKDHCFLILPLLTSL
jgi:hypothetical protein